MMKFSCNNCKKEIVVQGLVGSIPLSVPLHTYCNTDCMIEFEKKNTDNANDN